MKIASPLKRLSLGVLGAIYRPIWRTGITRKMWKIPGLLVLASWIYNFLKPEGLQYIRTQFGVLVVDPSDQVIARRYVLGDQHESGEKQFIAELLQPGDIFIDVGANIGDYTLLASRRVRDSGLVCCFEPSRHAYQCLQAMIEANSLRNVKAFNMGLGRGKGRLTLYLDKSNLGNNSFSRAAATALGGSVGESYDVDVDSLDSVWIQLGIPARRPRLIKIDVQGAEADVLAGAARILEDLSCDVIFELQPLSLAAFGCEPLGFLHHVAGQGRSLYRLSGSSAIQEPVDAILSYAQRHGSVDVFATGR
jgi:FkbM family methyltransferase